MATRRAVREALRFRADLGVEGVATGACVDRAVAAAGVERWPDEPMPGRLYGAYYRGVMWLRAGLLPGMAAVVAAHELGHAVLGHGAGAYRAPLVGGLASDSRAEDDAHVFAFTLIVGEPADTQEGLDAQLHAAYEAGVPLSFLFTATEILARGLPERRVPWPPVAQHPPGAELGHDVERV